jgi:surface antigen
MNTEARADRELGVYPYRQSEVRAKMQRRYIGPQSPRWLSAAVWLLLTAAAQAQVIPFHGNFGPGLSPEDNRLMFESVARLNAVEPSQVGRSEAWSNPQTKSHGTSTILKVFHSGGMACHLVRHHIVAGRPPNRDYRLSWCRTPTGEWKIKG